MEHECKGTKEDNWGESGVYIRRVLITSNTRSESGHFEGPSTHHRLFFLWNRNRFPCSDKSEPRITLSLSRDRNPNTTTLTHKMADLLDDPDIDFERAASA